eukprot:scaffold2.g6817.t1
MGAARPVLPAGGRKRRRPTLAVIATAALVALSCTLPFRFNYSTATNGDGGGSGGDGGGDALGLQGLTAALQPWLDEGEEMMHRFAGGDANVVVHRSSFAASMEHALDANATVGLCEDGRPLLAGMPEHICRPMVCLWSARLQRNVDLSFHGLADLPWEAHPKRCPEPAGGQAPLSAGQAPHVSLVLLSGPSGQLAAQSLLELFRTAREAETAELLVVDSTAGDGNRLLERAASRLAHRFGVALRLLPAAPGTPTWAAAAQALAAAAAPYAAVVEAGTFVARGWLYGLLHTMEAQPKAGVVGPLVLQQEHVVLEAGGLVRANGSLTLVGQGEVLPPEYSALREVDFVSHSCFLLRMAAWKAGRAGREADGLSGLYADAAVMLSVAHQGYTTLVQPMSVVFRQAGAQQTAAADEEAARVFQRRWQHLLRPAPCDARPPLRGMWGRGATTSVMWVDDVVPMPDNDSGSVRTMSLLKILVQAGYVVTFQPLLVWRRNYALPLQMLGIRVLPVATPHEWRLTNATGGCLYDGFVVARRTNYAIAKQAIKEMGVCVDAPQIFDTVDLHFMREARELVGAFNITGINTGPDLVEWMDLKAPGLANDGNQNISDLLGRRSQECELIRTSDASFLVMEHYVPDSAPRLHLVTNIHDDVDPRRRTTCQGREGLLFVGNYNHAPNREAVAFLLEEILPRIRKRLPPHLAHLAHAHIVGAGRPNAEMQELLVAHAELATFYGYLPDDELRLLYSRVKVVVAPLLTGAGVKGKVRPSYVLGGRAMEIVYSDADIHRYVNQAMKLGVPVVGTHVALEGMHTRDGVDCLMDDSAEGMAEKVVQLYEDCVLWERLAEGGVANMQAHFSADTARPLVLEAFRKVGLGLPTGCAS